MVDTMTIADALTELKRINKLLPTRYANIRRYSSKRRGTKDEVDGQAKFIKEERQSAEDLINRYKSIKLAINKSNLETDIEFEKDVYSVAEAILYKQQFYEMHTALINSFTADNGNRQVNEYVRFLGGVGTMSEEDREKIDLVPELLYSEKEIIRLREYYLNLYSFVDALIEKSNHATTIEV